MMTTFPSLGAVSIVRRMQKSPPENFSSRAKAASPRLSNVRVWFLVRCLALPECARHAVVDGLDDVLEKSPFRRLDVDLRRHAGRRAEAGESLGLLTVELDADNIDIGWPHLLRLLLVSQRVRRQIDHVSRNHWRDPLAERGEPHCRLLTVLDAVNVLR